MKDIGYSDNRDILDSAVRWGACPNCYSTDHRICSDCKYCGDSFTPESEKPKQRICPQCVEEKTHTKPEE